VARLTKQASDFRVTYPQEDTWNCFPMCSSSAKRKIAQLNFASNRQGVLKEVVACNGRRNKISVGRIP
jgi:hypothetical protein